jgi:hypothetical protein
MADRNRRIEWGEPMRHHEPIRCIAIVLAVWLGPASAWALDVKAGLWQITMDGIPEAQKVCYTRELLDSDFNDMSALDLPDGVTCKNEIKEQTAKLTVTHTVCSGPFAIEGDTRIDVQSPESMLMTSTSVMKIAGQQQSIETSARYTWLSADCGDVKPFDMNKLTD